MYVCMLVFRLGHFPLFVTPWPVAHQAPLFMGLLGENTGAGCHFLLQGIFPTQGLNLSLLPWLAGGFFTAESPRKPIYMNIYIFTVNSLGQKFSTENDFNHAPHLCLRRRLGISGDSFKSMLWLKDWRALNICLFCSSSETMVFNGISLLCLIHLSDFFSSF